MEGAYRDELQAAIARAEAAERKLASVCYLHQDKPADTSCDVCKRGICEACTMAAIDGTFCPSCFAKARAARTRKQTLILAGAGIGITAAAIAVVTLFTHANEPPPPPEVPKAADYDAEKIKRLKEHLVKEPCDEATAVKLAETMNNHGDLSAVPAVVDAYEARCGASYRLRWPKSYAFEQQKQFDKAIEVDTTLIDHEPHDQDYWWWRGQNFAALGRDEEAAADYRQSLASLLAPSTAGRFATTMKKLGRPCEAVFAIRSMIESGSDVDYSSARERISELSETGDCPPLEGQSHTTIKYKPNAGVIETQVTVDGASGHFFVDGNTGFLVVTQAFADKAGLKVQALPEINVWVAGAVRNARLAQAQKVSIGPAFASTIDVAVVDDLPPKVDGVVGNSFLYRFSIEDDGQGKYTISPHGETPTDGVP